MLTKKWDRNKDRKLPLERSKLSVNNRPHIPSLHRSGFKTDVLEALRVEGWVSLLEMVQAETPDFPSHHQASIPISTPLLHLLKHQECGAGKVSTVPHSETRRSDQAGRNRTWVPGPRFLPSLPHLYHPSPLICLKPCLGYQVNHCSQGPCLRNRITYFWKIGAISTRPLPHHEHFDHLQQSVLTWTGMLPCLWTRWSLCRHSKFTGRAKAKCSTRPQHTHRHPWGISLI